MFQYQLKGVSLLPRTPTAAYAQLPYEAVSRARYEAAMSGLRPAWLAEAAARGGDLHGDNATPPDAFCVAEGCELPPTPPAQA